MEFNLDLSLPFLYPSLVLEIATHSTTPTGLPALSTIVIAIALDCGRYSMVEVSVNHELAKLDQLFASTSAFPSLHTISINVKADSRGLMNEVTTFWAQTSITKYMPLVAARHDQTLKEPEVRFWEY